LLSLLFSFFDGSLSMSLIFWEREMIESSSESIQHINYKYIYNIDWDRKMEREREREIDTEWMSWKMRDWLQIITIIA